MAVMRQYRYSLDEPLLWFAKDCPWRIRDALEGTAILGDIGSGKTSRSGRTGVGSDLYPRPIAVKPLGDSPGDVPC
jgi:hypothetical protein